MRKLMAVLAAAAFGGLVLLPAPASADIQFGIKAGGNMANVTGADIQDLSGTMKNKVGFMGGLFLALNFGKVVTVQWEALYTMKGATFQYVDLDETYTDKLYGDYLEIPLLLKLRIPTPGIQPFVFAGPTVGFKLREKFTENGVEVPLTEKLLKNNDYGAIFGAGLNIGRHFMLDVRYSMGLQKVIAIIGDEEQLDIKNGVWGATIGIAF